MKRTCKTGPPKRNNTREPRSMTGPPQRKDHHMQRKTTKKKTATKKPAAKKAAKAKRETTKQSVKTAPARQERKKDIVLGLLQRENGATLAELMTVTGWQAHSV